MQHHEHLSPAAQQDYYVALAKMEKCKTLRGTSRTANRLLDTTDLAAGAIEAAKQARREVLAQVVAAEVADHSAVKLQNRSHRHSSADRIERGIRGGRVNGRMR